LSDKTSSLKGANRMMSFQLAKDTFYATLRDRIAAQNPARTVVVRQTVRPGVVVSENELPGAAVDGISPADAFCLRWTAASIRTQGPLPLLASTCEIRYATDGTSGYAGLDRGRALAAMDSELAQALSTAPQSVCTIAVTETSIPATTSLSGTTIFWADLSLKPATMRGERMERVAEIEVFSHGQ
jgi:hypothetical protein